MANDIVPCRDSLQMENENFATNDNGKTVRRVEDEAAISVLNEILVALCGSIGTVVRQHNLLDSGSVTKDVYNDIITLTLDVDKVYSCADYLSACSQFCSWQLVQSDDGVETIIESWVTGPGSYTVAEEPKNLKVTTGSTGVQELVLRGKPFKETDLHGRVSVFEVP